MKNTLLTEMTGMDFHKEFVQCITEDEYTIISNKLGEITPADKAKVRELYFINENQQEKEAYSADEMQEVFWISNYYKPEISGIYLNKRCKTDNHFLEEKVSLSQLQYIKFMSGDYDWMKKSDSCLLTEFYVKKQLFELEPKFVIESRREHYFSREYHMDIRIDREIVVENPKLEVEQREIRKMFDLQPIIMDIKVKENAVKEFLLQFYNIFKNVIKNKEIFKALDANNEILALT